MNLTITVEKGGGSLSFSRSDISELSYVNSVSFDGNEMQCDELYAVIRQTDGAWLEAWKGVTRNAPVWLTRNNAQALTEKMFFKTLQRVSNRDFRLTAQSPIGRLTSQFHGGLYSGQSLPDVIAEAIGGVIPRSQYSFNEKLRSVSVYGWAPYQSRRETLHMLAIAYGFIIRRDGSQNLFFTIPDADSYALPQSAIFTGGSADYRIGAAYARIDVTAYDFRETDADAVTLFDNSGAAPANRLLVKFENAPVYGLAASDSLQINESGVNYAIVSGIGVLTGKPYAKIASVVSAEGDPDADPERVLSISDVPLITSLNADSVAEKFRAVHNAPAVVSMDILRTNQRAGDRISFTDSYGDPRTGYITELSGSVTSIDRAAVRVLCGYEPVWGAAYDSVIILDDSGTWTVPDALDGKTLRIVLIGGGQGGASGRHGTDDTASGCGRGAPGAGGKVYEGRIAVSAGQSFQYQSGAGGAGGVPSSEYDTDGNGASVYRTNLGSMGSASLFGDFSSDAGGSMAFGYRDMIQNVQYALPGPDNGVDGGAATSGRENGDRQSPAWINVERYAVTPLWDASQSWTSGDVGDGLRGNVGDNAGYDAWAYGGLGGGAAVGANGFDGADAPYYDYGDTGGDGGNGADASAVFPSDTRAYGSGGSGGHGGGEGGRGGHGNTTEQGGSSYDGKRGSGGSGSSGENGADGCILIYFHS